MVTPGSYEVIPHVYHPQVYFPAPKSSGKVPQHIMPGIVCEAEAEPEAEPEALKRPHVGLVTSRLASGESREATTLLNVCLES